MSGWLLITAVMSVFTSLIYAMFLALFISVNVPIKIKFAFGSVVLLSLFESTARAADWFVLASHDELNAMNPVELLRFTTIVAKILVLDFAAGVSFVWICSMIKASAEDDD
jgi:hypothetical protein